MPNHLTCLFLFGPNGDPQGYSLKEILWQMKWLNTRKKAQRTGGL